MMFIVLPTNIDYLLPDFRIKIGDYADPPKYSDNLLRTALVAGVRMLQRRWNSRYVVYTPSLLVDPLPAGIVYEVTGQQGSVFTIPSGYMYVTLNREYACIPSGLVEHDVFKHPDLAADYEDFTRIDSADEYPLILAASITLKRALYMSSADTFQTWSDGEYSFSNVAKARAFAQLVESDEAELAALFRQRLHGARAERMLQNHVNAYPDGY